jgi:predicted MFS family arabinose efflux permease
MYSPRVKTGVFVLEGLNSFATMIYFSYLFFVMRDRFGFTNLENLTLCAVNGAVYAGWVSFAGRLAQRRGYFWALKLGFAIMGAALVVGSVAATVVMQYAVMIAWTFGIGFTWPCLEAITSEHEPPRRLQRMLGIYNLVWSLGGGVAAFVGGSLLGWLGPKGVYLVPAALHAVQVVLAVQLERESRRPFTPVRTAADEGPVEGHAERDRSPLSPRAFLVMAWVANPFAYVAMNAVIPVIPDLARRFSLSAAEAGAFGSVWALSRAVGFLVCWQWTGWHYRFRWLFGAYALMVVSFALILLGAGLWPIVAAQAVFGLCVALIYYASLYYSMDMSDTKGEHGGFHEAAIGAGIFGGPAVGAVSLYFFPALPNMNAWAVSALLLAGLGWLSFLRRRGARAATPVAGPARRQSH